MNKFNYYLPPQKKQRGVSMVEVLVALVIIALALLGTAGLQAHAMRLNQGGQFRSQAIFLVADLAERMEANKAGSVAGSYILATASTAPALNTSCDTSVTAFTATACDSTALATYDLAQWQNAVATTLPQSSWSVSRSGANPSTYTIVVNWVDRRSNTTYSTADTGETFSYIATRTVFN